MLIFQFFFQKISNLGLQPLTKTLSRCLRSRYRDLEHKQPTRHVRGGMTYARGKISVPTSGVYFMYCQVYHHNIRHHSNLSSRQRIFVNGQPLAIGGNHRGNYEGSYYTGLALPLNAGDTISCRLQYEGEIVTYEQHTLWEHILYKVQRFALFFSVLMK